MLDKKVERVSSYTGLTVQSIRFMKTTIYGSNFLGESNALTAAVTGSPASMNDCKP
jgi:hypothetical protein